MTPRYKTYSIDDLTIIMNTLSGGLAVAKTDWLNSQPFSTSNGFGY